MINKILYIYLFLHTFLAVSQDVILLNQSINLDIDVKGDAFSIKETHSKTKEIRSNNTMGLSEHIYFSTLDKLVGFKAETVAPTLKGKLKTTPVKQWETSSVDERGIFFSGEEKVTFNYPNAVQGALCKVEYTKAIKDPQFVSCNVFGGYYPIKQVSFRVTFPKHVDIHLELINADSLKVNYNVEETEHRFIHTYTIENIPEYREIEKLKSHLYVLPQIMVRIKSYQNKAGRVNIGNNIGDLYKWYTTLIHQIPKSESEELKTNLNNKIDALIKHLETNEEKTKAIYNWVKQNIKYIAFEDGMNGFIPRNAYHIFDNKYGDCKDMANLIKTMLDYADIPAYLTWIGTRRIPYTYNDVPSVYTDNHMICTAKLKNKYVFLDGTNSTLSFKAIPSEIQGKQALIGLSDTVFEVVDVPISNPDYSVRQDSLTLTLKHNVLVGEVNSKLGGYFNEAFKHRVDYGKRTGKKNFHLGYLDIGNKGYAVNGTTINKGDTLSIINIEAKFENYVIDTRSKLYLIPSITDFYVPRSVSDLEERDIDIHEDYKFNHKVITQIRIPKGYNINKVPEDITIKHPLFSFEQHLIYTEGQIELKQDLKINFITLEKKDFEAYSSFLNTIKKAQRKKLTLIKE